MRVEITVHKTRREEYLLRKFRKWAARSMNCIDLILAWIQWTTLFSGLFCMMADESVPAWHIVCSFVLCEAIAAAAWFIRLFMKKGYL